MALAAASLVMLNSANRLEAAASAASRRAASCTGLPVECATIFGRAWSRSRPEVRPGEATLPANTTSGRRSLIEVPPNEPDQRVDCRLGIGALSTKMNSRAFAQLQAHHPHDAFGIDPASHTVTAEVNLRFEALGELGELHRGSGVKPDLMRNDS